MKIVFYTAMFPKLRHEWERVQMLGFGYLAAALRRAHPDLEIALAADETELLAARADVVGISCVTYTYNQARRVAAQVRAHSAATIVVGGPHVTALPERLGAEFDYGVIGEGEATLCELVSFLKSGGTQGGNTPDSIAGLVFWRDGERFITPPRPLIEPIDDLPHPDREFLKRQAAARRPSLPLMTSRGCPYDCAFCATTRHWQRMRMHSSDYVLEELDEVVRRYDPWQIVFEDDLLIADRKRLTRITEGILQRGYPRRVRFHVNGRANLITDEVAAQLRAIHCTSVFIGFESASDAVLGRLGKRAVSGEVNQRAIDILRRHGIGVVGSFILGTPGETFDDLHATYVFIKRNLDAFVQLDAGLLRLLPGTEIWELGLQRGLVDEALTGIVFEDEDIDDGWHQLLHRYPLLCDTLSRHELLGMFLAFQELANVVRERHANPQNINNMRLRRLAAELARRLMAKIGLKRK